MTAKNLLRWFALGHVWRFIVSLIDWRTHFRRLSNRPLVDAVFISNIRDETDRKRFNGSWHPEAGHTDCIRYAYGDILGRVRAIDSLTSDLLTSHGRKKAKEQFISAVQWAEQQGAKVVLLAASTKRLFGDDGRQLKEMFPNMIFTIGDNGTAWVLLREIRLAFDRARLNPAISRIAVLGPYGILGRQVTGYLAEQGYRVVGAGPNAAALHALAGEYGIEICASFEDIGQVDAVICCTHSARIRLTAEAANRIRVSGRKLLVIDVAEPSNLTQDEYEKCRSIVMRQDAGNAYNKKLKYVLGAVSYRMFRLTRGVTFGCFAETLALTAALKRGENIRDRDWFSVSKDNMAIVDRYFNQDGFATPTARCFGTEIKSFNLLIHNLRQKKEIAIPSETVTSRNAACRNPRL